MRPFVAQGILGRDLEKTLKFSAIVRITKASLVQEEH